MRTSGSRSTAKAFGARPPSVNAPRTLRNTEQENQTRQPKAGPILPLLTLRANLRKGAAGSEERSMKSEHDTIIIGAGIIGCCIAYELSKKGYRTVNVRSR